MPTVLVERAQPVRSEPTGPLRTGLERARGVPWERMVRVGAPLGAFVVEGPAAAVGTVIFQEAGLWFARRIARGSCQDWAVRLFVVAYAVRVLIALPTHYVARLSDGVGAQFLDDYTNDLVAEWLVRVARGEGISVFPGHQHLLEGFYPYLLMSMYAVFGHTPLLPKMLNAVLGAVNAILVFEIARRAFRPSTALVAGGLTAVMPSLLVWSVVAVKESLVLSMALLGLWAIQRLASPGDDNRRADALVLLIMAVVASLDLRATTSAILLLLVALVVLARAHDPRRAWRVPLAAAAAVVLLAGGALVVRSSVSERPPLGVLEDVVLQLRHRRAQEAAGARSQIRTQIDIEDVGEGSQPLAEAASDAQPFSLTADVFEPLGYALLAPAPWQARGLRELAVSAEMLGWYTLLGASFLAWRAGPRQPLVLLCLVAYGVANWLVLAASEGNLGNLLRHRIMLAPTLLVLGGAGLNWLWLKRAGA